MTNTSRQQILIVACMAINIIFISYVYLTYAVSNTDTYTTDTVYTNTTDTNVVEHALVFPSLADHPRPRSNYKDCPILTKPNLTVAIVTALYHSEPGLLYYRYLPVLSHTVNLHHPNIPRYVLYLRDRPLSDRDLCMVKKMGWIPYPVSSIPHPRGDGGGPYKDQFNKFNLWTMTDYDAILYMDVDAYMLRPADEIFPLARYACLLAVQDNYGGDDTRHINAGVLLLRPNNTIFEILRKKYIEDQGKYDLGFAEQGFLNYHFRHTIFYLPEAYNLNSAQLATNEDEFYRLQAKAKIHHLTWPKPRDGSYHHPFLDWDKTKEQYYVNDAWFHAERRMVESQWWKTLIEALDSECGGKDDIFKKIEKWVLDVPV